MASAPTPPPLLPVTNPAPGSSPAAAGGSDAPIATPAFRLFLSRISDSAQRSLSDHRLWGELLDRSAFSKPDSLSDATSRLRRNLAYFRVNYAAMVAFTLGASLLTHLVSLLIFLGLHSMVMEKQLTFLIVQKHCILYSKGKLYHHQMPIAHITTRN